MVNLLIITECEPMAFMQCFAFATTLYYEFTGYVNADVFAYCLHLSFPIVSQDVETYAVLLFINDSCHLIFKSTYCASVRMHSKTEFCTLLP